MRHRALLVRGAAKMPCGTRHCVLWKRPMEACHGRR